MNIVDNKKNEIYLAALIHLAGKDNDLLKIIQGQIRGWFSHDIGVPSERRELADFARIFGVEVPDKWEE